MPTSPYTFLFRCHRWKEFLSCFVLFASRIIYSPGPGCSKPYLANPRIGESREEHFYTRKCSTWLTLILDCFNRIPNSPSQLIRESLVYNRHYFYDVNCWHWKFSQITHIYNIFFLNIPLYRAALESNLTGYFRKFRETVTFFAKIWREIFLT